MIIIIIRAIHIVIVRIKVLISNRGKTLRHHKFRKLPIVQAVMLALIGQTGLAQNEGDLETITIVGSPEDARNISGSASVITMEDLETYEYTDIHKILSSVPGVNFRPEEGYGLRPNISIRGTYADRSGKITLMEDGVLIAPGPYSCLLYTSPSPRD